MDIINLKLMQANLNKILKWTSSKFNEYKKQDVVNYCLDLEHNIFKTKEFNCGSYSEKSYCGGYNYEIAKGIGTITIIDKNQNKIYKLHTLKNNK